jgi:hypothetical protein
MSELFGRIILERKSEFLNRLKNYRVNINGTEQGKISNGSSAEYEVPGGNNMITCKVNWCGSNTFTVDIKPGETVYLKVASGMKYFWAVYIPFVAVILGRLLFKSQITPPIDITIAVISGIVMLYFLYYITIGRKQYLKVERDSKNIFAN